MTVISHSPWLGILSALAGFVTLVAVLKLIAVAVSPHAEWVRKLLHVGSGLMTLSFPVLFSDVWPVLLLTGTTTIFLALVKFVPWWRRRLGDLLNDASRATLGELYFPVAVALVFALSHGRSVLLFAIPVLVLTIADATGALVGLRYGRGRIIPGGKSLAGSLAFLATSFLCIQLPLLLWGSVDATWSIWISATLALLLTAVESRADHGTDNLFIPLVGYFFLLPFLRESF